MNETFDYIVVGAGSAGCITAAELSDAGHSVLLLESGGPAERHPETLRTDGYKEAFINDQLLYERFTVPLRGVRNRKLFAGTGRGVGGSGSVNAMVYTRGAREDFEAWGPGWRWQDVAPDFAELERRLEPRRREPTEFTELCINAAERSGIHRKADLNDGELANVLGYEWMNFKGGDRRSSYVAFIKNRFLPNLTVRTDARVLSVVLDPSGRAKAVRYRMPRATCVAEARRGSSSRPVRSSHRASCSSPGSGLAPC
ncbi:MAG: GMC family oxidoreductase N-terminal domain-containing protein [Polyangiaceae bacterium]